MNSDERAICARLKLFRENIVWDRADFASQVGLSHDRLASIELARTPLPYEVAWKIRERFGLSMTWLFHGQYPPDDRDLDPWPPPIDIEKRYLLSEIGKRMYSRASQNAKKERPAKSGRDAAQPSRATIAGILKGAVSDWVARLPETELLEFYQALFKFGEDYLEPFKSESEIKIRLRSRALTWDEMRNEINKRLYASGGKIKSKPTLDIWARLPDNETVKQKIRSLSELIELLRALTKKRGMKADLARYCNVTRQAVNQWLSENSKPSADAMLLLLNWVEDQQHKNKNALAVR